MTDKEKKQEEETEEREVEKGMGGEREEERL